MCTCMHVPNLAPSLGQTLRQTLLQACAETVIHDTMCIPCLDWEDVSANAVLQHVPNLAPSLCKPEKIRTIINRVTMCILMVTEKTLRRSFLPTIMCHHLFVCALCVESLCLYACVYVRCVAFHVLCAVLCVVHSIL